MISLVKYFFICMVVLFATSANAAPLKVVVVLADELPAYHEFVQALLQEAEQKHLSATFVISHRAPDSADIILAVGINAVTLAQNSRIPVLAVLVSKAAFEPLLAHQERPSFSAIYLDQPLARQVSLLEALFPDKKKIGVLNSANSPDRSELSALLKSRKLKLVQQTLSEELPLTLALETLLSTSDVLLALPDAAIYNGQNIRFILLSSYRNQIPLVGFAKNYVAAGALAAVFSTTSQMAGQTLATLAQFASSRNLPSPQYPQDFEVLVNPQVAHSLNLNLPDASVLLHQLKAAAHAGGG